MSIKKEDINLFLNNAMQFYIKSNLPYHNFKHIQDMIDIAESYDCKLTLGQFLAILYHDCIYIPGAKDNEEQSIKSMYQQINIVSMSFYKRNEVAIAEQIIFDTKNHIPTIKESELIIDLDLVSLGYEPKIFSECRNAIYDEYKKVYVNKSDRDYDFEILFHEGTVDFGNKMLTRNSIYCTDLFKDIYEKKATTNLFKMVNESLTMLKIYQETSK